MAITLVVGQTFTVSAVNNHAPDAAATWTTSDATKVSISSAGPTASIIVTGVALGSAVVTASDGACSASETFQVVPGSPACGGFGLSNG